MSVTQVVRILGIIRQSRTHADAVSVEMQKALIERRVEDLNRRDPSKQYVLVGWAIDAGVSADKTTPWERPELGPWLNERFDEFDIAISWKLDRVCRSILDFARFIQWLDDHKKSYLCVDDPIDLSTPIGRAVAQIMAILAELELNNIKTRNKEARKSLHANGRWAGGRIPYGFMPVKLDDGWTLKANPEEAEIVHWMVEQAISGASGGVIAHQLNKRGIKTALARQVEASGRKPKKEIEWNSVTVNIILRSRTLIGQLEIDILEDGKKVGTRIVTGADRRPVEYCEPLISLDKWAQLQKVMNTKGKKSERQIEGSRNSSLLRKVGKCGVCGLGLHYSGAERFRRYRCGSRVANSNGSLQPVCLNPSIQAPLLEEILVDSIMDRFGNLPRIQKVHMAGEDHTAELAQLEENIATIRREKYAGFFDGSEDEYFNLMKKWTDRRAELLKQPVKPAGYRYVDTGQSVAEYWQDLDREARNRFLQEMRVTIAYDRTSGATSYQIDYGDLEAIERIARGIA
ncbi:recombinase family protein [Sphaerimonospora cavernae]|uniref:Recombinase family protein n=1 Tax=Sphaerimonospora cavernae TaxID=1740611 RepID=A0ABV6UCU2_9ACTN